MTMQMQFDFSDAVAVPDLRALARQTRAVAGKRAYLSGHSAETAVLRQYLQRGLTLAQERWRGSRGEIDLILRDGAALVFVEVKKSRSFARAADALSMAQMRRIYAAASEFLAGEPNGQLSDVRFDVALVNEAGEIALHENAFGHF